MQILISAKARKEPEYVYTFANPNRMLGENHILSGDPSKSVSPTAVTPQHNGQPAFGDDDFFLGGSA